MNDEPITRGDVRRIEAKLDRVLVGLHGDGSRENPGLFHRVEKLEEFLGWLKGNVRALWTGGIAVAAFVAGEWIKSFFFGGNRS